MRENLTVIEILQKERVKEENGSWLRWKIVSNIFGDNALKHVYHFAFLDSIIILDLCA